MNEKNDLVHDQKDAQGLTRHGSLRHNSSIVTKILKTSRDSNGD